MRQHFPETWEVHSMAIHAEHRHQGMGRRLLAHAEDWLITQNARFLQVKTVADTSPCPEYAETRKFYAAQGFIPLEIFPALWDPHNPALQCIKTMALLQDCIRNTCHWKG